LPAAAPELPEGVERRPGAPDRPRLVVRSAESPACTWLAADAEGNRLLASYEDGSAALWQLRPVQLVHRFPPISRSPRIALTPDGTLAIVEGPEPTELTLWDTATGRRQGLLPAPDEQREEWIATMAMHPGGRFLAVLYRGRDDDSPGRTLIWDLPARRVVHRLVDRSPRRMADLAFTPDGRWLAVGYRAAPKGQEEPWDRIDVWDWQAETRERGIRGEGFGATSLAFSDDGRRLLAKEGWELVLRDFHTGEPIARWSFRHGIPAGALTGDGARLVGSTLGDGRLFRSTVAEPDQWTWTPPAEGRSHTSRYAYAYKLVVMGDRNLVFSPGNDGRIHVWHLDTLAPAADLFTRNGHRDWIAGRRPARSPPPRAPGRSWPGSMAAATGRWSARWLHRPETVAAILSGEPAEPPRSRPRSLSKETFHVVGKPARRTLLRHARRAVTLKEAGAELRINRDDTLCIWSGGGGRRTAAHAAVAAKHPSAVPGRDGHYGRAASPGGPDGRREAAVALGQPDHRRRPGGTQRDVVARGARHPRHAGHRRGTPQTSPVARAAHPDRPRGHRRRIARRRVRPPGLAGHSPAPDWRGKGGGGSMRLARLCLLLALRPFVCRPVTENQDFAIIVRIPTIGRNVIWNVLRSRMRNGIFRGLSGRGKM
jgi:hypothetical protein